MDRRTFVYYHLPGDFDDAQHPNVFMVSKGPDEIKLKDIIAAFPLPGKYHFRFKQKLDSSDVWLDISNPESLIPVTHPNAPHPKVFVKILRVSWVSNGKIKHQPAQLQTTVQNNQKNPTNLLTDWNGPNKYLNAELINGKEYNTNDHVSFSPSAPVENLENPRVGVNNPLDTKIDVGTSPKNITTTTDDDIMKIFDPAPTKTTGSTPPSKRDDFDLIFT